MTLLRDLGGFPKAPEGRGVWPAEPRALPQSWGAGRGVGKGGCADGWALGPEVSSGRIYMFLVVQVQSFLFLVTRCIYNSSFKGCEL